VAKKYKDSFMSYGGGTISQMPILHSNFKSFRVEEQKISFNEDALFQLDLLSKEEPNLLSSCVGGYQSRPNLQEDDTFSELIKRVDHLLKNCGYLKYKKMKCVRMWTTICGKNSEVKPHRHEGHISGIYYLQGNGNNESGNLVFETEKNFAPTQCDCFLFESKMGHFVRTNLMDFTKVSLNFDLVFEQ
tara:strand:- start:596 stop:1159 length:564 start_codon:yes stop_codon:yes gene_type:complete